MEAEKGTEEEGENPQARRENLASTSEMTRSNARASFAVKRATSDETAPSEEPSRTTNTRRRNHSAMATQRKRAIEWKRVWGSPHKKWTR